jgi:predicted CDP-diglyceride synthetase/phosphatidate cytidylyltransferase
MIGTRQGWMVLGGVLTVLTTASLVGYALSLRVRDDASRKVVENLNARIKAWWVMCQGKVEMSPSEQNRNVPFCLGFVGVHVNLLVPVKRRRALLASNPIEE